MARSPSPLLDRAEDYFQQYVVPLAGRLDCASQALAVALTELGDRGFLALKVPEAWGGAGADAVTYWQFQQRLARASGALAFLQAQHQSAAAFLAQGQNENLKARWLPAIVDGKAQFGISFSHLRRPGEPWLRAVPQGRGYCLQGSLPWATGKGLLSHLVVAATLPEGDVLWLLLPFCDQEDSRSNGTVRCSDPIALAALGSVNTVSVCFDSWPVEPEQVIDQKPADWLGQRDRQAALPATALVLGCAEAALQQLEKAVQQRQRGYDSLGRLRQSWDDCQTEILQALEASAGADPDGLGPSMSDRHKLVLRVRAIALMGRCTQAAIVAAGGAANLRSHPAQRLYREALVFSVSGQTEALWEESLAQLSQGDGL